MANEISMETHEHQRCEFNKKTLHRIHRIQGQLAALARLIEADAGTCEERVVQARTIEQGMSALITHLVDCYLVNTARFEMEHDPDTATKNIRRILELVQDHRANPPAKKKKKKAAQESANE
jgi:DNA-binding FrmR family transcriptional regulator